MSNAIWINLPVRNIKKSKAFFDHLGFTFNEKRSNDKMLAMSSGDKKTNVMLFDEATFKHVTGADIADTKKGTEVLFSVGADRREEVDELADKAVEAGGILTHKPAEIQGWMYGCAFGDLDGHRWNVLYMDMSKMPG